jgi:hypothetical protein
MNKYSSNYSQLSQLILKIPDDDQAILLKIADKLLKGGTLKSSFKISMKTLTGFALGIFSGSCLTMILIILFEKIYG